MIMNGLPNSKIANLIAIKSFYESKNDFISAFSYFVLQSISTSRKSLEEIRDSVKKDFNLDIPLDLVKTILKRLKREKLIEYSELKSVTVSKLGKEQLSEIQEDIKKSTRELNSLLKSIELFIKNKYDKEYLSEDIEKELNYFVKNNLDSASLALQGLSSEEKKECRNIELGKFVYDFFKHVEVNDEENFNRLKSLVCGIMIVSILKKDSFDVTMNFESLVVYLDTNMVFSLLGFHDEAFNKPTQELVHLMKEFKFKLKIFSFTKEEILHVLGNYLSNENIYSPDISVDSIYLKLKQSGYTDQDVRLLIQNISDRLRKFDIEIDNVYQINTDLTKSTEGIKLKKVKNKGDYSINHDLSACELIAKIRGERVYLIERSKAIFLTADKILYNFNLNENDHIKFSVKSIPEVITRDFLVSILWLKKPDPNSNLPIHNIIAGYRRNLLVSPILWEKFILALKRKKDNNEITDEDIALIISSNETENLLLNFQRNKKSENFPNIIDELMQKQKKTKREMESGIGNKNRDIDILTNELKELKEENLELKSEIQNKNKDIESIKKSIDLKKVKEARRIINEIIILISTCVILFAQCLIIYFNVNLKFVVVPFFVFLLIIGTLLLDKDIIPKKFKEYLPPINILLLKNKFVLKVKNNIK